MAGGESEGGGTGGTFVASSHSSGKEKVMQADKTVQMLDDLRCIVETQR